MSIRVFHVQEQETSMEWVSIFGGVYSVVLPTWNFEYALALHSLKAIYSLCDVSHVMSPMSLFMLIAFPN